MRKGRKHCPYWIEMMTIDTMPKDKVSAIVVLRRWRREYLYRLGTALWRVVREITFRTERQRSRRLLLEMTDEQLKDIGVSRADATKEARRSILD